MCVIYPSPPHLCRYTLLTRCWHLDAHNRPDFGLVLSELSAPAPLQTATLTLHKRPAAHASNLSIASSVASAAGVVDAPARHSASHSSSSLTLSPGTAQTLPLPTRLRPHSGFSDASTLRSMTSGLYADDIRNMSTLPRVRSASDAVVINSAWTNENEDEDGLAVTEQAAQRHRSTTDDDDEEESVL